MHTHTHRVFTHLASVKRSWTAPKHFGAKKKNRPFKRNKTKLKKKTPKRRFIYFFWPRDMLTHRHLQPVTTISSLHTHKTQQHQLTTTNKERTRVQVRNKKKENALQSKNKPTNKEKEKPHKYHNSQLTLSPPSLPLSPTPPTTHHSLWNSLSRPPFLFFFYSSHHHQFDFFFFVFFVGLNACFNYFHHSSSQLVFQSFCSSTGFHQPLLCTSTASKNTFNTTTPHSQPKQRSS